MLIAITAASQEMSSAPDAINELMSDFGVRSLSKFPGNSLYFAAGDGSERASYEQGDSQTIYRRNSKLARADLADDHYCS